MYTFLHILFLYRSVSGMSLFRKCEAYKSLTNENGESDYVPQKGVKYVLNNRQILNCVNSINCMMKMCKNLIKHIKESQNAIESEQKQAKFLSKIEDTMNRVSKIGKECRSIIACDFEFCKFCEYFYHVMFHIIQHEKELHAEFINFSFNKILPILQIAEVMMGFFYRSCYFDLVSKISRITEKKIGDDILHELLFNFCIKYLMNKEPNQFIYIKNTYAPNGLLPLCFNIFARLYLIDCESVCRLFNDCVRSEYPISAQFRNLLFHTGRILVRVTDARSSLNLFLSMNNLDLEKRFMRERIISSPFEAINFCAHLIKAERIAFITDE